MNTWRARLAVLLLAAIAGLTSWLIIANNAEPSRPASTPSATPLADYSMREAVVTRYAPSGKPRYVLRSTLVTHERNNAISRLKRVKLNYYSHTNPYWHLSARRGKLSDNGQRIVLVEHVRAHQPAAAQSVHLFTSKLMLLLETHRIRSQARVTLRQGPRETRGVGLRANLDTGVVKLLRDVTSRYVD